MELIEETSAIETLHAASESGLILLRKDKSPIQKKWQSKSVSLNEVFSHLKRGGGIGIVPASIGMVVLDVDTDDPKAIRRTLRVLKCPPAANVKTKRGQHLWFFNKYSRPIKNAKWKYGDIRGSTGFIKLWDINAIASALKLTNKKNLDLRKVPQKKKRAAWTEGDRNNRLNELIYLDSLYNNGKNVEKLISEAKEAGLGDEEIQKTVKSAKGAADDDEKANCVQITEKGLNKVFEREGVAVRFNTLGGKIEITMPQEWDGESGWRDITSIRESVIKQKIAETWKKWTEKGLRPLQFTREGWNECLEAVAIKVRINPVLDYFTNLPVWDGKERIGKLLNEMFGMELTEYSEWVSSALWIGVVQRTLDAGCPVRIVPVLIGPESIGKSAFIREMLPKELWNYRSTGLTITTDRKHNVESIVGKALAECAELSGVNRLQMDALKAFLTPGDDTVRLSYERHARTIRRTCYIIGTANPGAPLPSERAAVIRFASVNLVHGCNVEALMSKIRPQCWAEALERFEFGAKADMIPFSLVDVQKEELVAHSYHDDEMGNIVAKIEPYEGKKTVKDLAVEAGLLSDGDLLTGAVYFNNERLGRRFITALRYSGFVRVKVQGWYGYKYPLDVEGAPSKVDL